MSENRQKETPSRVILASTLALIALAAVQVMLGRVDFESYNHLPGPLPWDLAWLNDIAVISIGLLQALIVAVVFMGLKAAKPVSILVFMLGCFFALAFIIITLTDTQFRGIVDPVESERVYLKK